MALFGWYGFGNFGDDLMAVIFGLFLQQKNIDFSVYRLCGCYAEEFGFDVADTVDELLRGKNLLVYGGGGRLNSSSKTRPRLIKFANELSQVLDAAEKRKIPVYGFSLGGNGIYPEKLSPPGIQDLLEKAEYISVRNHEDTKLLNMGKTRGDFFPDIVWQTPAFFPVEKQKNTRPRIGINLFYGQKIPRLLPSLIHIITWLRKDIDFIFIDSVNQCRSRKRAVQCRNTRQNTTNYAFHILPEDIGLITSLDLLISSRLHLGMVCMSYGIPFISLCGEKKTRLFMKDTGLIHLCFKPGQILDFMLLMLSKKELRKLINEFEVPDRVKLKEDSYCH